MLATKSEYQGSGVGPTMMVDAFRKALEAAKHVGIYAITLQAINKRTADKYALDFDFRPFDDGTNITEQSENIWMFLPLETARKAFTYRLWEKSSSFVWLSSPSSQPSYPRAASASCARERP
jgi:hypothetical protein